MLKRASLGTVTLACALLFSGCGGGSDGGSDGAAEDETHAIGEEAVVGYNEVDDKGERGPTTTIGMTVLGVRIGTREELIKAGLDLEPDGKGIPHYVDVRWENQGDETVKRLLNATLEDSDGNLIGRTIVLDYGNTKLKPCPQGNGDKFKPGQSYESCSLFLVPPDIEVGNVGFLSDKGPDTPGEFVYWETDGEL